MEKTDDLKDVHFFKCEKHNKDISFWCDKCNKFACISCDCAASHSPKATPMFFKEAVPSSKDELKKFYGKIEPLWDKYNNEERNLKGDKVFLAGFLKEADDEESLQRLVRNDREHLSKIISLLSEEMQKVMAPQLKEKLISIIRDLNGQEGTGIVDRAMIEQNRARLKEVNERRVELHKWLEAASVFSEADLSSPKFRLDTRTQHAIYYLQHSSLTKGV